jgi:hypothetical protein
LQKAYFFVIFFIALFETPFPGSFRVEMQRESEKDRKITCKYDPLEAGEYQINVKWSGEHVPNSPFNVRIFRSKEDMLTCVGQCEDADEQLPSVAKYDTLVSAMASIVSEL